MLALALAALLLEPLAGRHRVWFSEEVPFLISSEERARFEALSTTDERDRFIESFWRRRDPTPGTLRNEAREEHGARLAACDRLFRIPGPGTPLGAGARLSAPRAPGVPRELHRVSRAARTRRAVALHGRHRLLPARCVLPRLLQARRPGALSTLEPRDRRRGGPPPRPGARAVLARRRAHGALAGRSRARGRRQRGARPGPSREVRVAPRGDRELRQSRGARASACERDLCLRRFQDARSQSRRRGLLRRRGRRGASLRTRPRSGAERAVVVASYGGASSRSDRARRPSLAGRVGSSTAGRTSSFSKCGTARRSPWTG